MHARILTHTCLCLTQRNSKQIIDDTAPVISCPRKYFFPYALFSALLEGSKHNDKDHELLPHLTRVLMESLTSYYVTISKLLLNLSKPHFPHLYSEDNEN